jgi:hypothetical protein
MFSRTHLIDHGDEKHMNYDHELPGLRRNLPGGPAGTAMVPR